MYYDNNNHDSGPGLYYAGMHYLITSVGTAIIWVVVNLFGLLSEAVSRRGK